MISMGKAKVWTWKPLTLEEMKKTPIRSLDHRAKELKKEIKVMDRQIRDIHKIRKQRR